MNIIKKVHESIEPESSIFLCGDFNLPNLKWEKTDVDENTYIPMKHASKETVVIESCHEFGLYQLNYHLNDNNRILDLFWSSEPEYCTCEICLDHLL